MEKKEITLTKTIYFVRHGQSAGNRSLIKQQTSETLLTIRGRGQARKVAKHLKKVPLDALIASTYTRAQMTAAAISEAVGLPVESSDLFVERRRPGIQLTKRKIHPYWLFTEFLLQLFGSRPAYRHSDEETADDLLERARAALKLLQDRPEKTIAVVTHKTFMRALHTAITFGEGVPGRVYLRATRGMAMMNTALMVAQCNGEKWEVITWNANARDL